MICLQGQVRQLRYNAFSRTLLDFIMQNRLNVLVLSSPLIHGYKTICCEMQRTHFLPLSGTFIKELCVKQT